MKVKRDEGAGNARACVCVCEGACVPSVQDVWCRAVGCRLFSLVDPV